MTFLPQGPVLNKKEQDTAFKFSKRPYNILYKDSPEGELFEGVKVKRKEEAMPKLNFKPLEIKSYNQMAINKYKVGSPLDGSVQTGAGSLDKSGPIDITEPQEIELTSGAGSLASSGTIEAPIFNKTPSKVGDLFQKVSAFGSNPSKSIAKGMKHIRGEDSQVDIKDVAADVASGFAGTIDIPLQQFAKGSAGSISVLGGAYYFAEEFAQSLPDLKEVVAFGSNPFRAEEDKVDVIPDPDFMKAAEKTEDLIETTEWFFGTKLTYDDYLDVRSSHEKRTEIFNSLPVEKQQKLQPLENYTLAFDVTAGILSGLGAAKAPLALANTVGRTTTLGRTMVALDTSLDAVVGQLPKLGVAYGATALAYYYQTGKWIFEGDDGATEGAAMFMMSAGLKGFGKLLGAGWEMSSGGRKYIKDMWADPEFQKGVRTYFDEAKKSFGDQIDEFATKVGAKTNLLPDSPKVIGTERMLDARVGKLDDEVVDIGTKGMDILKNASNSTAKGKKGFFNKAVSEGVVNEGDSMYQAISRKAKLVFSPEKKSDEIAGVIMGDKGIRFKENFKFKDAIMGNFLEPAKRGGRDSLEGTRVYGKIQNFNNILDDARSKVDDLSEFNAYLFAKSRYFKTRGKSVETKLIIENSKGHKEIVNMDEAMLEKTYLLGEEKYGKIADGIHKEYQSLLQYEHSLGIRTDEDILNFAKNPYWMPDRALDTGAAFNVDMGKLSINTPKEFLSKSQDVVDNNTMMNMYGDMSYRYEVANRIDKLMKGFKAKGDLVKRLTEGKTPDKGFVEFKMYEGGEQVSFQGRDFFVKSVLQDDKLSTNVLMRGLSIPTALYKSATTGILDPVFQTTAPYFEISVALFKNWLNGGKASDFLTTAIAGSRSKVSNKFLVNMNKIPGIDITNAIENAKGGDFFETPAMKKAFIDLANFQGGTFTKGSRARIELEATLGDEFTRYSAQKTAFEKGKDKLMKVRDAVDVGNSIELYTTRLPMFAAQLKKEGITPKIFKELSESSTSPTELSKKMEAMGVNPQDAANVARNLYDYQIAKHTVDESGRVLAYLSDFVARGPAATKRMIEDNPNLFTKMMGVGMVASTAIYEFNTNNPEKEEAYNNAPDYVKNSPYLFIDYNKETGEGEFLKITKNLPMLDFVYPLVNQMKSDSEGQGFDFKKGFNKMVEGTTGLFSLETGINVNILPDSINRYATYKTGFDLKRNYQKFKRTNLEKTMPSEDYDKRTSNFAIGLSRMIAILNGGEITDVAGRKVVTGDTWSPRLIDTLLDNVDSGIIRGQGQKLMDDFTDDGRVDRWKTNEFVKTFIKKVSITKFDEEEYADTQKATGEEQLINNIITTQVKNAPTNDLAISRTLDLVTKYPRKEEAIMKKLKERVIINNVTESGGDLNLLYMSKLSNAVIARKLIADIDEIGFDKTMDSLIKMTEQGVISETKARNIIKSVMEISNENIAE